jgi:CheY-like chemotaxis protein
MILMDLQMPVMNGIEASKLINIMVINEAAEK